MIIIHIEIELNFKIVITITMYKSTGQLDQLYYQPGRYRMKP